MNAPSVNHGRDLYKKDFYRYQKVLEETGVARKAGKKIAEVTWM